MNIRKYEIWRESTIRPRAAAWPNFSRCKAGRGLFLCSIGSIFCEVSELNEQIVLLPVQRGESPAALELTRAQWMIVDICVRSVCMLGLPRSIGEIFGLAFCSVRPISFDDVVRILKLSNGTASHGLRYLKRLGALRTCYLAQDRRDYYVPETSLRKIVSGFFAENIFAHLGETAEQMIGVRATAAAEKPEREVNARLELLLDWNRQIKAATSAAMEVLV